MGFRFYRRINIAPGLSINLGKKGASVSVGPRGAKMTFGPNGTRTSVGIPGTGIRYEKRYSKMTPVANGGGGGKSICGAIAVALAAVAIFAYQVSKLEKRTPVPFLIMVVAGIGAAIFAVLYLTLETQERIAPAGKSSGARYSSSRNAGISAAYATYIKELGSASLAIYGFLRELNRSTRCRNQLKALPGMAAIDSGDDSFSINKRLAAIAYCDLRSCFRKLGYDEGRLAGLPGIGYAMIVILLINRDFDIERFLDDGQRDKLLEIVSELKRTTTVEINIKDHEDEFRFALIFGALNHEPELVQRFATHLYRWASLIAKADGTVTPTESSALEAIMKMNNVGACDDGNVRVTEHGSNPKGGSVKVVDDGSHAGRERSLSDPDGGLDAVMNRLDGLIGLKQVKNEVKQLTSFIEIQHKRKARGMKVAPVTYHCVFTGNPGTGKTTVARILADIFRELGVVKKGHLVETDRSGLVAEYVGQTAVKTNKVIDTALDGVLFIDEAYTLVQGGDRDYGGEAIATLLKRMEDDRDRLVVVLAGYTNEMKQFINSNPGLQSRFSRYIEFPDYTATELAEIFLMNAEKNQYACDKDVQASIVNVMEMAVQNKDKNFGNARYVRNLFEKAIQRQAVRLSTVAPITTEMLSELTLHDLGFAYES